MKTRSGKFEKKLQSMPVGNYDYYFIHVPQGWRRRLDLGQGSLVGFDMKERKIIVKPEINKNLEIKKLQMRGNQGYIFLPIKWCRENNLKKGDIMTTEFSEDSDDLIIEIDKQE